MVVKLPSPRGEGGGHAPPGEGSLRPPTKIWLRLRRAAPPSQKTTDSVLLEILDQGFKRAVEISERAWRAKQAAKNSSARVTTPSLGAPPLLNQEGSFLTAPLLR